MTYCLKYELDANRLIMAVVNDTRAVIPSLGPNADGNAVYAYSQGLIGQLTSNSLVYRLTSTQGNLGGILALQVQNGVASVLFTVLRPAYQQFALAINEFIANFIVVGTFTEDYLY